MDIQKILQTATQKGLSAIESIRSSITPQNIPNPISAPIRQPLSQLRSEIPQTPIQAPVQSKISSGYKPFGEFKVPVKAIEMKPETAKLLAVKPETQRLIDQYQMPIMQRQAKVLLSAPGRVRNTFNAILELNPLYKVPEAIATRDISKLKPDTNKILAGLDTFNLFNDLYVQPFYDSAKLNYAETKGQKFDLPTKQAILRGDRPLYLNDVLGNTEQNTDPVQYTVIRFADFAPSLIDIPLGYAGKTQKFAKEFKVLDETGKFAPKLEKIVAEKLAQFSNFIGRKITPEETTIIRKNIANPTDIENAIKNPKITAPEIAKPATETQLPKIVPTQSEIINLEPSTATLRTGRYGQNADVVAQVVKDNVTEIGKKMSPKINLKNIDELARKESTIISKETEGIYNRILKAVENNPKFSEELAILQQQQTAKVGEAIKQAGGNMTPELLDALVRPKGFDRLVGQQLVSLKNSADGIFTAVSTKNINSIESSIGRKLTGEELKTLNGITNLEDASSFADELRFTAKKLNKYSENILQLENELRKLDDYEAQWLKAREYIAKNNIDVGNPEKFAEVYRMFFPANIDDWFNLIQYNSMLSAPTTFLNNLSYVTTLLKNTAGYTVQGALQQLKSKIYKGYKPEYDLGSGVRYAGGYLKGTWKALGQPTKEWFGDVLGQMKNTKNLTDTPNQIPALQGNMWDKSKGFFKRFGEANKKIGDKIASMAIPSPEEYNRIRLAKAGTALGYTEDFLKIPSNALEMADAIMGIILREGELSALSKGVKFKNAKASQKALRDLFKGDLTEEGAGLLSNLIGGLGELAMKARNFKSGSNDIGAKSIRAFANFTLPFVRIPTNWLKIGLEYTPAGALNLIGAKDKTVPLAKVITGLPISIFVASKYANGEITGGMPQDKKTRDYWTENGIKPFSIKIGDTWYDYTKFNPFMSVTMMTTVGAMEAFRQKDITQTQAERLLATTMSVYEYWSQQSFVQNMGLLQNINSSDFSMEKLNKLGYNALSRAVPYQALLRWYSRLQDGSIKDPQTFKQTFEQNLPYFKQFAPNKVDSQGNNLKDEFNIYNSFPVFGRKSQQKAGAMEGLNELRNEQFINKSKTEIQKIIDEDVKKVAGGQISSLDKGQAPALIAGLNNIDPLNVYWLNPVGEKLETIGLDFTKYAPQNQSELKTYENKVNKIAQEVQYNPYISEQELTNILNRINIPENRRTNATPEEKQQYFKLSVPEEKQPKVKASEEEKKKLLEFANLRAGVEAELPMLKLQKALSKAGQGKKPRLKKASLKKTKLAKAKIGSKLAKNVKLKPIKFAKTKLPTPKKPKNLA